MEEESLSAHEDALSEVAELEFKPGLSAPGHEIEMLFLLLLKIISHIINKISKCHM